MPGGRETLRAAERLRSGADYRRVFRRGLRVDGRLFLLIALESGCASSRLGLAVGRAVGGAVERNRAKRLLRASFRRHKPAPPLDLVLIAKREILGRSLNDVEREYQQRLRRLLTRRGPAPGGAGAASGD